MADFSKKDINAIAAALGAKLAGSAGPAGTRDAFFISVESVLAPLASDTQRVTLDVDADYLIITAVGDVRDNAAPQTRIVDPPIMITLSQSQSGRQLQNIAVQWNNLIGTASLNAPWPAPKHLAAGTTLSITQTSLFPAATTMKSRITLWGYKIFAQ
jgi:hypothetical protein